MKFFKLLVLLLFASPVQADDSVQKVLDCMRANLPQSLRVQDIDLTATDRAGGARTLKGKLYAMRESLPSGARPARAMLRIVGPESLAGAAYLMRESDTHAEEGMYVYLPSVKRVRRITGEFADGSLLGTNFSYGDFKLLASAFGGAVATLEGADQIDGRPVQVLLFKNAANSKSPYRQVRAWIDREACIPIKADFYAGDIVRKRLTAPVGSLQKSGEHWYQSEVQMQDLAEGSRTVLRVLQVQSDAPLSARYFDPEQFAQSR